MFENEKWKLEAKMFKPGDRVEGNDPAAESGLLLRTLDWISQHEERRYLSALTRLIMDRGSEYGLRCNAHSGIDGAWLSIVLDSPISPK